MDLAQRANRVKRDLQAAAHKPETSTIRSAVESFDAFVDAVVEEIGKLKAAQKEASGTDGAESSDLRAEPSASVDVADEADADERTGTAARRSRKAAA